MFREVVGTLRCGKSNVAMQWRASGEREGLWIVQAESSRILDSVRGYRGLPGGGLENCEGV